MKIKNNIANWFLFLIVTFSCWSSYGSIEDLFIGASKKFPRSSLKEIIFELDVEKEGLFGIESRTHYFKMFTKINKFDQIEWFVEEYSNASFAEDKLLSFSNSLEKNERYRLFEIIVSTVFFGRSKELFKSYEELFQSRKVQQDLSNNDSNELVITDTEKKNYKKSTLKIFKRERNQESLLSMVRGDESLGSLVASYGRKNGITFNKTKHDKIVDKKFSKVIKVLDVDGFNIQFDTKDFNIFSLRHGEFQIILDQNSSLLNGLYPRNILFISGQKKSMVRVIEVRNFRKKVIDFRNRVSKFASLGLEEINFIELAL